MFKRKTVISIVLILIFIFILSNHNHTNATSKISLTEEEKEFIKSHPEIRLGVDPSFVPYEFIDKDGVYKGIASDYLELIRQQTGLNMVIQTNLTWPEAYERAVNGEIDVLPCISKTEERAGLFLFSDLYYSFQRAIFIKDNNNTIKDLNDLLGKKVAVQTNSSHHSYLKTFPNIELKLFSSVSNALASVSHGSDIAFVGNEATSNYLIKLNGISKLKSIKMEMDTDNGLYFAVRKDWPELVSILNKSLANITHEERIQIDNKWTGRGDNHVSENILRLIAIISAIVVCGFILSSYWIVKLKNEIKLRKKAEVDLKQLKEEADLSNSIKSIFLARMSHEIRTPLNAITGMTYLLTKTDITETQRLYLGKITQSSMNMLGIINDILDFSKIESGKIELENIPFDLDLCLEQVVNIVSYRIEEQGIEFSINKSPDTPNYFIGDPLRIQQILLNLINNAIKFTKEGSVFVYITLIQKNEETCDIEFKVKDTGIGMSSAQLSQIFKPFDQGDSSITRKFGGTGLGLTIAKNLVNLMSGDIHVDSAENVGSTFTFELKLSIDYSQEKKEIFYKSTIDFSRLRVLVIEKSQLYSNILKDYLVAFHITPEFATSDDEGLKLLQSASRQEGRPYNLLLLDYSTPSEGGLEFFAKLSKYIDPLPKCILMIPIAREHLLERLDDVGIDFGIIKPFLPSTLFNSILEITKKDVLSVQPSNSISTNSTINTSGNNYHLLIVEDNKTNQMIAETILKQAGYQVSVTEDGKEGYEFFSAHSNEVDLILMDLHMPVLNGYESTELIRKINKDIPIIAMTADAITGVEEKCSAVGINYYISKPFDPDKFVETIANVLLLQQKKAVLLGDTTLPTSSNGSPVQQDIIILPELDREDGLCRIGGNKELYNKVLKQYEQDNLGISELIRTAVEKDQFDEAVQLVHKLKSSSGNIGAKNLYQISCELQKALTDKDSTKIAEVLPLLLKHLHGVLTEIQKTPKKSI